MTRWRNEEADPGETEVYLYAAASERFPLLRTALNAVSDRLLFPDRHSPERLMRQVRDEARWRLSS